MITMKETVSIRLEKHFIEQIDRLAQQEGTSRTEVIREALRVYFKTKESAEDRSFVPFSEYKKLTDEVIKGKYEMGQMRAKVEALEEERSKLREELKRQQAYAETLASKLDKEREVNEALKRELADKEVKIKELELKLSAAEKEGRKRWRLF